MNYKNSNDSGAVKPKIHSFKELKVWQLSHQVVLDIYSILNQIPKAEEFRIISQLVRCTISVPANIAEGTGRETKKELSQHLIIARGSNEEIRYFLILILDLKFISQTQYDSIENKCSQVSKMLNGLLSSLNNSNSAFDESELYSI
ncbi:MAG: four helix bundle protein [Bacteroidetes bacterium]|nr:four helix bundle protein [Bacteroidota bacterium]